MLMSLQLPVVCVDARHQIEQCMAFPVLFLFKAYAKVYFILLFTAKPELKGVDESDDACYHYLYVLTKNAN